MLLKFWSRCHPIFTAWSRLAPVAIQGWLGDIIRCAGPDERSDGDQDNSLFESVLSLLVSVVADLARSVAHYQSY